MCIYVLYIIFFIISIIIIITYYYTDQKPKTTTGIYLTLDYRPYTNFWSCSLQNGILNVSSLCTCHITMYILNCHKVWSEQTIKGYPVMNFSNGFLPPTSQQLFNTLSTLVSCVEDSWLPDMYAWHKLHSLWSHNQMRILFRGVTSGKVVTAEFQHLKFSASWAAWHMVSWPICGS